MRWEPKFIMEILLFVEICLSTDILYPRNRVRQTYWHNLNFHRIHKPHYSQMFSGSITEALSAFGRQHWAWVTDTRSLLEYFSSNQLNTSIRKQISSAEKRLSKTSHFLWHNKSPFVSFLLHKDPAEEQYSNK